MEKIIKGYKIWIEGTWCEVTKDGKFIYEGSVSEDMTCEDVYKCVTANIVFKLNDKVLMKYTAIDEFYGEREETLKTLAYENNCKVEDIEVIKELGYLEDKKTYEIIQSFLNIDNRPKINSEGFRDLDYSLECDRAYIRSKFKRFIKENTGKELRIYNSWGSAYQIKLHESKTSTIDGLNKIFELTKNAIEAEEKIFGVKIV